MTTPRRLLWSTILFGVLWTLGLIYWTGTDTANIVILMGLVVVGALWYFATKWWVVGRH